MTDTTDFKSLHANAFAIAAAHYGHRVVNFTSRETLYNGPAFFTDRPSKWVGILRSRLHGVAVVAEYYDTQTGWIVRPAHSSDVDTRT